MKIGKPRITKSKRVNRHRTFDFVYYRISNHPEIPELTRGNSRLDDSLGTVIYFTGLNSNHTLPDCFLRAANGSEKMG